MKFGLNERPLAAQFDVDASSYSLESQNRPPDRTGLAALKREHEAVAYDTGLREQIEASIDNT